MLHVPPIPFMRRRRIKPPAVPAPPPLALTLVSAVYAEGEWVELTFDRAIDISAIAVGAITVDDGPGSGDEYVGTGSATLTNPTTVRVPVTALGPSSGGDTVLIATAATGIIADDDGGTWAGVAGLLLPFPE